MQTVILATGRGTRMGPLTDRLPKPLLPVAGTPLLGHSIRNAIEAGASTVHVVARAEAVREFVDGRAWPIPVSVAVGPRRRGAAAAVRTVAPDLRDDPFVVLEGDTLHDADSLAALYDSCGPAAGAYRVTESGTRGVLDVTGGGLVRDVAERPARPPSDRVSAGAYVLPAAARSWLDLPEQERGGSELVTVLRRACNVVDVTAVPFERWLAVDEPWDLLAAAEWKLAECQPRIDGDVAERATLRGRVRVAAGATVGPGVVVEGPVRIGRDAHVGPNACVRGATDLGPGTRVGHGVEVKNSVVMAGTAVPHLTYLGDSVVGREVNFGAGTQVANLRHDGEPVRATVDGRERGTGRRKFGVVCGDGVRTGVNTSIDPGVTLGTDARTYPGETVTENR